MTPALTRIQNLAVARRNSEIGQADTAMTAIDAAIHRAGETEARKADRQINPANAPETPRRKSLTAGQRPVNPCRISHNPAAMTTARKATQPAHRSLAQRNQHAPAASEKCARSSNARTVGPRSATGTGTNTATKRRTVAGTAIAVSRNVRRYFGVERSIQERSQKQNGSELCLVLVYLRF